MIYQRRRLRGKLPGGYFNCEDAVSKGRLHGFGHGEHILLRDESGNVWKGSAERSDDDAVRYTLRDEKGCVLTGVSDHHGIILRDGKGRIWRGFVD